MFDNNMLRMTELDEGQDRKYIEKTILQILKEQKVSLSQTRSIFYHLLEKIEDNNTINL